MAKVSVILPTFNSSLFIYEAISSILKQTHKNLELIIIDDKSTDDTIKIIKLFRDKRIRLIETKQRLGIAYSLNLGIKLSKSKFIARMDSDDISEPNRIEEQVNFLIKNKHIDVVGSSIKIIDEVGRVNKFITYPKSNYEIKFFMCLGCPIVHPSVMMRKSIFEKYGIYYKDDYAEDYELWSKLLDKNVKFYNLDKYLLKLRKHKNNASKTRLNKSKKKENNIILKNIEKILNLKIEKKKMYCINIIRVNGLLKIKSKNISEVLKLIYMLYTEYVNKFLKLEKNNNSEIIKRKLYEKVFIIRVRNLKDLKSVIVFILEIILNLKFTIYLFMKMSANYCRKLNNLNFLFF